MITTNYTTGNNRAYTQAVVVGSFPNPAFDGVLYVQACIWENAAAQAAFPEQPLEIRQYTVAEAELPAGTNTTEPDAVLLAAGYFTQLEV